MTESALIAYLIQSQLSGLWDITKKALDLIQPPLSCPRILDIGCGSGKDTIPLLRIGGNVVAIDKNSVALELLEKQVELEGLSHKLTTHLISMEDMRIQGCFDLIVSGVALPFCHPDDFSSVWLKINGLLNARGVFAGHFFGERDSWSSCDYMTTLDEEQVKGLFDNFDIHVFDNTEERKVLVDGSEVNRHTYHVLAQLKK